MSARSAAVVALLALAASWAAAAGAGPAGVTLPPYEQATLANGAQVALMTKRDTPMVGMTVLVRGGALADAPGREGTTALLASLMQKGAGSRNAVQFAEAIEGVGGELAIVAGTENHALGASFLPATSG